MKFRLCLMIAVLAMGACGDSGRIDLGLPRGKALNEITDAEARTICENVDPADIEITFSREQECTIGAVFASSTQAQCEMLRDACLARPPEPRPTPEQQDCSMAETSDFADCRATVGEAEDCLNDYLDASESYLKGLTCADAATATDEPPLPPSCVSIQDRCPSLLDD